MRILFCLLLLSAIANFATAQQTTPQSNDEKKALKEQQAPIKRSSRPVSQQVTPQSTPTKSSEADIRAKQLATLEKKGVNIETYKILGLDPLTATQQDYNAAKEKLYNENRPKYNEVFKQNNTTTKSSHRMISRSDFNKMSVEQQAYISANSERFKIVD